MSENTTEPHVYGSVYDLVEAEGEKLNQKNFRAYKVDAGEAEHYVATNSPANAALSVVSVARVASKEITRAAVAVAANAKAGATEK